ncbi:hypothetical protein CAP48_09215 [Advenella sp. S44]|nr:hypothetical protein CAP48_09215 [Advenella sp. S44]
MGLSRDGVGERTSDVILSHSSNYRNSHYYAIGQLREIYDVLGRIARPSEDEKTVNLHAMIRQALIRYANRVPQKSRRYEKVV